MSRLRSKPLDSEIDIYGLTHQGKVRAENQDHFLVCQVKKQTSSRCQMSPSRPW